jgi:predicted permease
MNWRRFFHRSHADDAQREELELYLDLTAEEFVARGMEPDAARDAARRKLGNATLIREEVYVMNSMVFLEEVLWNARHALRMIRLYPGFATSAILSLALGTGAIMAMFSVVHAVLIRPLPYPEPAPLVGVFNSGVIQGETFGDMGLGPALYAALKEQSSAFADFGVWSAGTGTVTGLGDPEQIKVVTATYGVLSTLGVRPSIGRWFSREDDTPGTVETAILCHGYWQRRFGGDKNILGRMVVIDSVPRLVIGVMPRSFRFLDLSPEILLPQRFATAGLRFEPFSYPGIARLKPGLTIEAANRDTARVLNLAIPDDLRPFAEQAQLKPNLRPLKRDVIGDIGTTLYVLLGGLGLVFLLVCANVANLVLIRAQTRTQEFAVRAALGAGWSRIGRELLVESLTLGLIGGACGSALAWGALMILKAPGLTTIPRIAEVSLDTATLAFGLACSIAGSLFFGLIAILKCGIPGKIVNSRGASAGQQGLRAQNALVVTQISMALVLLVASGLLIRSFVALRQVNPGFTQPERIQTVRVVIPDSLVPDPVRVAQAQVEMVEKVRAIPGVEAVGFGNGLPMEMDYRTGNPVAVEDKFAPGRIPPNRRIKYVSPGLFAAQGTRILAGRDFSWDDSANRRQVAIVSENMAREHWGSPNSALGRRLMPGASGDDWREIVGVVENVHDDGADKAAPAIVYFRTGVYQQPGKRPSVRRGITVAIRSGRTNSEALLREVAAAIHAVNPNVPLAQVRTLEDVYRRSMSRTSFTLVLLGIAGTMALVLAIIGVYGVLAYAVGQRQREVSIRVALGAQPNRIKALFVRRGLVLACAGIAVGLAGAIALSQWLSSLLFGVTPFDPVTYVGCTLIVYASALVASYLPARRVSSLDPMESLRAD